MVIAYVVVGMFAGLVCFAIAILVGASFWFAILLYSFVGAVSIVLMAVARLVLGEAWARNLLKRQVMQGAGASSSSGGGSASEPLTTMAQGVERAMKILAVDDDAFILELIPKIAAKVGCPDITTASSGTDALALLEESSVPFDCLLLDINMPGMDGIELCARIRNMSAYRDTPIIVLTAMTDMDHLDRAFLAGASDYTTKPFDIIEFGDRLQIAQARTMAKHAGVQVTDVVGAGGLDHDSGEDWGATRIVSLAGITALIECAALQNYLMRLTGSALTGAYVMAVMVEQNDEAADQMSSVALSQILMQVAVAIDEVFSTARYVMAYAGEGQFVLVSNAARLPLVSACPPSAPLEQFSMIA